MKSNPGIDEDLGADNTGLMRAVQRRAFGGHAIYSRLDDGIFVRRGYRGKEVRGSDRWGHGAAPEGIPLPTMGVPFGVPL